MLARSDAFLLFLYFWGFVAYPFSFVFSFLFLCVVTHSPKKDKRRIEYLAPASIFNTCRFTLETNAIYSLHVFLSN